MPLAFKTESHGDIPVGFFNIDTDMILINDYFVFASDFCKWITEWAMVDTEIETEKEMYFIDRPEQIGNLMGAIAGVIFTGFIGEVYKLYPFPEKQEDFKQKPDGFKTRGKIEEIIKKFSTKKNVNISTTKNSQTIALGDYLFKREYFHEVISYIWRGGMPGWKNDERPEYVNEMMKAVISSKHWLFRSKGIEI